MPNSSELQIGDRIRFIDFPESWSNPSYYVSDEDRTFMATMIARKNSSRISFFDESGWPCIRAITKHEGAREYHCWAITEDSGWVKAIKNKEV